jgi:hypothetical protein
MSIQVEGCQNFLRHKADIIRSAGTVAMGGVGASEATTGMHVVMIEHCFRDTRAHAVHFFRESG